METRGNGNAVASLETDIDRGMKYELSLLIIYKQMSMPVLVWISAFSVV